MKKNFNHSGSIGDVLYSLSFVMELLEQIRIPINQCSFNLQINQPADYAMENHPWGNVMLTEGAAKYILPLLKKVGFHEVGISENIPSGALNLSNFRKMRINTSAGDIRSWYYDLVSLHLPQNFSRKIIKVPRMWVPGVKEKVIVCLTNRYRNCFLNLKVLEPFKDSLLFLGFDDEYESFCKEFFELGRVATNDAMNTALIFNSAKGVISNQSGNFTIAEQMKCPRILLTPEFHLLNGKIYMGPVNNMPQGGFFETVRTQQKLVYAVENLLRK